MLSPKIGQSRCKMYKILIVDDESIEREGISFLIEKYKLPLEVALNSTPFVRQYDILSNKWGVLLCQKEYQTNDIRRSSRKWL